MHRARKIKERLQPALLKGNQDESTRRRLGFLDRVLTKVINRFEEAFPECRHSQPKPKPDYELESSDEEILPEEKENESPPSPTHIRRSSSMSELARGLQLEEGDVHRVHSLIRKRNIVETDLTGQQLLEAILKVDKDTVEREVWDEDGLHKVLRKNIHGGTASQPCDPASADQSLQTLTGERVAVEGITFSNRDKKDSDSHSI